MGDLRNAVTHYIDHIQDTPWVESLVARHGLEAVLQACVDVLAAQQNDEVQEVTTLLRDIGIGAIANDELTTRVRELMPDSVLPALRPLLRSPVLQVRMAAIYTIGKLSFPSEAEALREVFPAYLDKDPLCLARLLSELAWLGDPSGARDRLTQIMSHESYLIRWSALGYLDCWGTPSGPELRMKTGWLETLQTDPAPLVAGEARHQLAELELEVAGAEASWHPKAEWRQRRRTLETAKPALTFSTVEIRFLNELSRTGQADYALEELAAFVDLLMASDQ